MDVKLNHVSITAHDAKRLAQFYMDALGLQITRPTKHLSGPLVSRGTGVKDSNICSIWLDFPGEAKPFLEIMEYSRAKTEGARAVNAPGYGHIALQVPDLEDAIDRILQFGGRTQGEVVNLGSSDRPCLCVYVQDPEGNILELETERQD